jgi:hypothetical protein
MGTLYSFPEYVPIGKDLVRAVPFSLVGALVSVLFTLIFR